MSWLTSFGIGLVSAVIGCIGAGFVADRCVRWYRISSFEGASGFYVVMIALLGLIAGLAVGIIASRIVAGWEEPGFLKGLGVALGSVVGLLLLYLGFARLGADIAPELDGRPLEVAVELSAPAGFVPPTDESSRPFAYVYVPGRRSRSTETLDPKSGQVIDGRWTLTATIPLETSASQKFIRVYFSREYDLMFHLALPRHPSEPNLEWSSWVRSGWDVGKPEPPPEQRFSLRYRVQKVPPPPPQPTQAEIKAKEAAEDEARFAAVPADAPITDWLPYVRYGAPEERRRIAIATITARAGWVEELASLFSVDEAEVAAEALRMVEHLPDPPVALNEEVAHAGDAIAALIRQVNASTVEQDPGYERFAEASKRFSAWMVAVRALRQKAGGDFTPQLGEILELSRVREDSYVMTRDIRRVASYYMQQWAGLAPLPGDPKPR